MNGWMETILRVDLTSGKVNKEPLKIELAHKYVGGRGLNAKILYNEIKPGSDPLGARGRVRSVTGASGDASDGAVPPAPASAAAPKAPVSLVHGSTKGSPSAWKNCKRSGASALASALPSVRSRPSCSMRWCRSHRHRQFFLECTPPWHCCCR